MIDFLNKQGPFIQILILVWLAVLSYFFWRINTHYRRLIGRSKREDLKEILDKHLQKMEETKFTLSEIKKRVQSVEEDLPNNIKKIGLVRFSPYREVGGNQSFSLSLLDQDSNGVVISALHSRDTTRVYAKPVVLGKETKYSLSEEEKEAVKVAKSVKNARKASLVHAGPVSQPEDILAQAKK